jgi:hypothetical protein
MATASVALAGSEAGTATVTLLARQCGEPIGSGSPVVQYDDIAAGFCLDILLSADSGEAAVNMKSATVSIDGDAGFGYKAMVDWMGWGMVLENYCDVAGPPPSNAQGWNAAPGTAMNIAAPGNLPIKGAAGDGVGSICVAGATAGFLGYLEFDQVPAVKQNYVITPNYVDMVGGTPVDKTAIGGMDDIVFGTHIYEPLTILPEPATALLLIGALAFLRRRR